MSQYPESGYRTGSLSGTGQFTTGQYGTNLAGTGQFTTSGADAEARRRAAAEAAVNAFPNHFVTAVLVAHDGARWLDDSLRGLLGQLRAPQRVLAVDTGSKDDSLAILDENLGPEAVLQSKRNTGFGTALNHALKASPPATYDDYRGDEQPVEWIWILHDDAEPAPDALLRLLETAESCPDAAVLGPKIRGWHDREQLLEVGVTVTADGRRWTGLDAGDHDQGQHADPVRVLSVSSAGMLVRRDVWDRLRGFDRAIPMFRDDLDFCWRVNNAGWEVRTAPKAVLYHAEAAARGERRISAGVSRPHFEDRQHALYAVTVNGQFKFVPLTFLRMFFWSLLRAVGHLLNKTPLKAADEVLAALAYAGRIDRIFRARRVRARTRAKRPVDLTGLFPSRMQVFRHTFEETTQGFRRSGAEEDERTAGSTESGPVSEEAESFDSGTPWLIRAVKMPGNFIWLALTVVMLVSAREVLTGGRLMGGALLPAPSGASDLWHQFTAGWHGVGTGSNSPAPPYLLVVALVGFLLFGHASLAVTVLLLGSVPLSGLTAYAVLRRTVSAIPLRIWGSVAYALLPAATGAISGGRLGSAVGIVLLPLVASGVLLAIGGPGRDGSVRAAWPASFALAVAMAFAPIVWVLAAALAIGAALTVFWRSTAAFATVLIRLAILLVTPIGVLAPWSLGFLKHPLAFLLEPGLPLAAQKIPAPSALLLANPGGPGTYRYWITAGLLLAGLAGLLRSGSRRRLVFAGWTLALAGLAAGLIALQTHPTGLAGGLPQQPWTGVPTAAIGFGMIVAAVVGGEGAAEYFRSARFSWRQPAALLVAVIAATSPVLAAGWWLVHGVDGPIRRADADFRPAAVQVQAVQPDQPRALVLGSGAQTVVGYGVVRGTGAVLGDADYQLDAATTAHITELVGGVLSDSGGTELQELAARDVRFIIGTPSLSADYVRILNSTPGLTQRSSLNGVTLWQIETPSSRLTLRAADGTVTGPDTQQPGTPAPTPAPSASGTAPTSKPTSATTKATSPAKTPSTGKSGSAGKTPTPTPTASQSASANPTAPSLDGQADGTGANGLKIVKASDRSVTATVPSAPADGRTLVLAEDYDADWTAHIGGTDLKPVKVDGWAQGFEVPAAGGTVTVSYSSVPRLAWLGAEGLIFLFALVMALPTGRSAEPAPVVPANDDWRPARNSLGSGGRGRRGAPAAEEEFDDEYDDYDGQDGPEGPDGPDRRQDDGDLDYEDADTYQGDGYQDDGYEGARSTGEFPRQGSGEYARPEYDNYTGGGEYETPNDYGQYDSYGRRTGGEYDRPEQYDVYAGQPGTEYGQAEEYQDPYPYQQGGGEYAHTDEYGGYLRPGTGEAERPDFEGQDDYGDYRPGGYR